VPYLQLDRAVALAHLGKVEEAVAVAAKLGEPTGADNDQAFSAARIFSAASRAATHEKQAREYADRAVRLLQRLKANGYFKKAENVVTLKRGQELRALDSHPEYQKLLADLSKP
jgi:hypothetical protein